jgi:hypothetical protein
MATDSCNHQPSGLLPAMVVHFFTHAIPYTLISLLLWFVGRAHWAVEATGLVMNNIVSEVLRCG